MIRYRLRRIARTKNFAPRRVFAFFAAVGSLTAGVVLLSWYVPTAVTALLAGTVGGVVGSRVTARSLRTRSREDDVAEADLEHEPSSRRVFEVQHSESDGLCVTSPQSRVLDSGADERQVPLIERRPDEAGVVPSDVVDRDGSLVGAAERSEHRDVVRAPLIATAVSRSATPARSDLRDLPSGSNEIGGAAIEISPTSTDPKWRIGADATLSLQRSEDGVWLVARLDNNSVAHLGRVALTVAALPVTSRADTVIVEDLHGNGGVLDLAEHASPSPEGHLDLLRTGPPADNVQTAARDGVVVAIWTATVPTQVVEIRELAVGIAELALAGPKLRHAADALYLLCGEILHGSPFSLLLACAEQSGDVTIAASGDVDLTLPHGDGPAISAATTGDITRVRLLPGSLITATFRDHSTILLGITSSEG